MPNEPNSNPYAIPGPSYDFSGAPKSSNKAERQDYDARISRTNATATRTNAQRYAAAAARSDYRGPRGMPNDGEPHRSQPRSTTRMASLSETKPPLTSEQVQNHKPLTPPQSSERINQAQQEGILSKLFGVRAVSAFDALSRDWKKNVSAGTARRIKPVSMVHGTLVVSAPHGHNLTKQERAEALAAAQKQYGHTNVRGIEVQHLDTKQARNMARGM